MSSIASGNSADITVKQTIEFLLHQLGQTTLVAIKADPGRIAALWIDNASADVLRWVEGRNQAGSNIYFTANRPQQQLSKKPKKSEIVEYRCLYADVDATAGRSMEECLSAIEQLSLPPSFVTMTGGGYQPVWLLDQPLPASPGNMQWAEAVGATLAALTKGDQVQNVDRILRLPATVNHPNRGKRAAGRTRCIARLLDPPEPMPRYTLEQLEATFLTGATAASGSPPPIHTRGNGDGRPAAVAGVAVLGPRPAHITDDGPHLNAAAKAGIPSFANRPSEKQNAMLAAMLEMPAISALADAPRAQWRQIVFALADAERLGAMEARKLASDWSAKSPKKFADGGEQDIDGIWRSFDATRANATTVGTLLKLAVDNGFDLHSWLEASDEDDDDDDVPQQERPAEPDQAEAPAGRLPPPFHNAFQRSPGGGGDGPPPLPPPPPLPSPTPEPEGTVLHMPIRFSENHLAYLFTSEHAGSLLYVHHWGTWLFWRAGRWSADHTVKVFDAARAICAREGEIAETILKNGRVASTQINKAATVAAIERLARHHHRHVREVEAFDADPMLLNTPDNTIDLHDPITPGRLHRREDYLTRTTAVAAAATAGCPLWEAFLLRIMDDDQDMVDYLQRVCGYMLTGSVKEHALFFGYGTGANGKGTFAGVLLGILSTAQHGYAAVAATSTFTASNTEQHPTDLAMLRGKRLVVAQETEAGRSWAIAKIKMMTGGDMITARFMRQDFFTYAPQFKLMIMGNHKPRLGSVDEATRRRFHLIPFTVEIPVGERDRELGDKLKAEYPQILRWMLEGYAAWQCVGLKPPAKVIAATEAYLGNEDTFGIWLEECCDLGKDYITRQTELFASWKNWSWNNGEPEARRKTLTSGLDGHSAFSRSRDTDNQIVWKGLKLRPGSGTLTPSPATRAKGDYKEIDDLLRN